MKRRTLYICRTYYNIYVTIVRVLAKNEYADLILDDFNEKNLQDVDLLYSLIIESDIFEHVYLFRGGDAENILPTTNEIREEDIGTELSFLDKINVPFVENHEYSNIYIYNDWDGVFGKYLRFKHLHYVLSEPSKDAFQIMYKTTPNTSKFLSDANILCYHEVNKAVGHSAFCDRIEVSSAENIPNYVRKKAIIVNIDEFLSQLNVYSREKIKRIFNKIVIPDYDSKTISRSTILLLTRPYCGSDKWLSSEKAQEKLIRDIINEYCSGGVVFIKPHPRDSFPYECLSDEENVHILSRSFPVEVLSFFTELHFDMTIAIGESCADELTISDKNVVLSIEWFKEKRKKYCSEEELEKLNPL